MGENDLKIKRQWLFLLVLSIIITSTRSLLEIRYNPLFNVSPGMHYFTTAFSLVTELVIGYVAYYCAYKKMGTKWLVFCLITTGISLVATPILYLKGSLQAPSYFPYHGIYTLVSQILGIFWFIACWRLRKVNKKLQTVLSEPVSS